MLLKKGAVTMTLAAAVMLAGCGDNTATGPDTAPPLAPQVSGAYTKEAGKSMVTWTHNAEADLAGYNVYAMNPQVRLNASPVAVNYFVDAGAPQSRTYRITAVDRSGNESGLSAPMVLAPASIVLDNVNGESEEPKK